MRSLDSLVSDEAVRQREFPVCAEKIYFAHASEAPLPRRVADAMIRATESVTHDPDHEQMLHRISETSVLAAHLIGASPEEIALVGPTSIGLSLIANGLDWRAGDEIVCHRDDYPSNVYPWLALQSRGVRVVYVNPETPGAITPEVVERAMTKRTRLVALATANFVNGFRIDASAIGQLCAAHNVLFSLDAIQSLGAFPLAVEHVDFLSAGAQKWLLGPAGAGIFYVKKSRFEELRPTLLGGWNVIAPQFLAQTELMFPPSARRYESGAPNLIGNTGLGAALELILEFGLSEIAARLVDLKRELVTALSALGFAFIPPVEGENSSGITAFSHPKIPAAHLLTRLAQNGIVVSLRHDRAGREYLRASPHFYNTRAEIEQFAFVLKGAV